MTILNRTSLTSSDKFNLLSKSIGCQPHGAISSLVDEFGVSRKTLYQARDAALQAIGALACTAPNSIRAIEEQLPLIYPGCKASYGYIQGVIVEAQHNAARFNRGAACQLSGILLWMRCSVRGNRCWQGLI